MNWISVKDELPSPFEVVWIFWRDREVLLGCRVYVGREAIECDPSEGWYSFEDDKCRWTHFWQRVDSYNLDKPSKPKIMIIMEHLSDSDEFDVSMKRIIKNDKQ